VERRGNANESRARSRSLLLSEAPPIVHQLFAIRLVAAVTFVCIACWCVSSGDRFGVMDQRNEASSVLEEVIHGSCNCGALKYRARLPVLHSCFCHCKVPIQHGVY